MKADRNEWDNLAGHAGRAETKRELAQRLPKVNRPPVPGSKTRLIEIKEGTAFWEGVPISPRSQPH